MISRKKPRAKDYHQNSPMISFRPSIIREDIQKRTPYGEGMNWVARRDLARYYKIMQKVCPRLSVREADLLNEWIGETGVSLEDIPFLDQELFRRLSRADDGFQLELQGDETTLLARLKVFSIIEKFAVVDAVEVARILEASGYSHEGAYAVAGLTNVL